MMAPIPGRRCGTGTAPLGPFTRRAALPRAQCMRLATLERAAAFLERTIFACS